MSPNMYKWRPNEHDQVVGTSSLSATKWAWTSRNEGERAWTKVKQEQPGSRDQQGHNCTHERAQTIVTMKARVGMGVNEWGNSGHAHMQRVGICATPAGATAATVVAAPPALVATAAAAAECEWQWWEWQQQQQGAYYMTPLPPRSPPFYFILFSYFLVIFTCRYICT